MKVIYTAPNRAHHYQYALALHNAGNLYKFVSGFSRWSPRAAFPEIGDELVRVDILQNVYLASLKFKLPVPVSNHLAYLAKVEQDRACSKLVKNSDIFLFYNGSGLSTCKKAQKQGKIAIVEAVNSHVRYQESLLKQEYDALKLPWIGYHQKEIKRRVAEYEQADYIMLPSVFVKRRFRELGFPEEKLLYVPYGFNAFSHSVTQKETNTGKDFIILYVGTISVRKGLRYLIEAFKQFNHPHKKLVIVGPKASPSGIDDISIPDNVTFTGVLKGNDLEAVYKSASVFCLPSIEDGFGLVLGESLSYGVPVIATENTGANDIITDGQEGFIVPIRNSRSIAHRLQQLADDPALHERMSQFAIQKGTNLKGWDETARILNTSLTDVFNRSRH
jgi:starch synthase